MYRTEFSTSLQGRIPAPYTGANTVKILYTLSQTLPSRLQQIQASLPRDIVNMQPLKVSIGRCRTRNYLQQPSDLWT